MKGKKKRQLNSLKHPQGNNPHPNTAPSTPAPSTHSSLQPYSPLQQKTVDKFKMFDCLRIVPENCQKLHLIGYDLCFRNITRAFLLNLSSLNILSQPLNSTQQVNTHFRILFSRKICNCILIELIFLSQRCQVIYAIAFL